MWSRPGALTGPVGDSLARWNRAETGAVGGMGLGHRILVGVQVGGGLFSLGDTWE